MTFVGSSKVEGEARAVNLGRDARGQGLKEETGRGRRKKMADCLYISHDFWRADLLMCVSTRKAKFGTFRENK